MASNSSLGSSQDTNQTLFTALLLLGLDVPALEKKLRVTIDKNSLTKMSKTLGQHVLHFCFVCIDPEKASKDFRDIWPVIDKKQEAQFNKVIFEWYKALYQGQGSGASEIIVKSAVIPGGPKFGKTFTNLIRMAVVAKIKRRSPDGAIVYPPNFTNKKEFDWMSCALQEAWKAKHLSRYTRKQGSHHNNLKKISQKSKEMVEIYRTLCKKMESKQTSLKEKIASVDFLTPQQKLDFLTASPQLIKADLNKKIEDKNSEVGKTWEQIDQFASVERSAWMLLSPLLDGSTALSYIDGKLYAPQIPQQILKEHAATISKTGLSSVYREGVLDLLSLVEFCNLCIKSISSCMENNQFHIVSPESTAELGVQIGRVGSMQATLCQTRENLNELLARLLENVAHYRNTLLTTASFTDTMLEMSDASNASINESGPPQLCFPTPPIKLRASPDCSQSTLNKFMPLSLTPGPGGGREVGSIRGSGVPVTPIHSSSRMTRAARRSPKANVQYSPATHTNTAVDVSVHETSIQCEAEAGLTLELLTVDCRAQHQRNKQDEQYKLVHGSSHLSHPAPRTAFKPSRSTAENSNCNINKKIGKENQCLVRNEKNMHNKKPHNKIQENKINKNILSSSENKNKSQEIESSKPIQEANVKSAADMLKEEPLTSGEDSGAGDSICEATVIGSNDHKLLNSKNDSVLPGCGESSDNENESLLDVLEMLDVNSPAKKMKVVTAANVASIYLGFASPKLRRSISGNFEERLGTESSPLHTIVASPRRSISSPRNRISKGLNSVLGSPSLRRSLSHSLEAKLHKGRLSLLQLDTKSNSNGQQAGGFMTPFTSPQKPSKLVEITPSTSNVTKLIDLSDERTLTPIAPTESSGLMTRLASLVEMTPTDTDSPHASPVPKFLTRLEEKVGSILSPEMNKVSTNSKFMDSSVEMLKHKSKTNLTNLVKQVRKMRSQSIGEFVSPKKDLETGRPRFLSYVENLKKEDLGLKPTKCDDGKSHLPVTKEADEAITLQFDRLDALLGDDTNTPTNTPKKTKEEDEDFIDGGFFAAVDNTPRRRSRFLPDDSVFDTLADSILYGETDSSILQQEEAHTEIQKEIIIARRQSITTNRMSIGGIRRLSGIYSTLSTRASSEFGIMDEQDDLLIWDSP